MRSDTGPVQGFGAKSGASVAEPYASGGLYAKNFARKGPATADPKPRRSNVNLKAMIVLRNADQGFQMRCKLFFGLNSL